ncbi:MAG: hypothetical protein Q4G07_10870 [Oscillospiraceae bacterium]|nr:hypothetical protein [Oscillospiraceae bacterium]
MSRNQRYSQPGRKVVPYNRSASAQVYQKNNSSARARARREQRTIRIFMFTLSAILVCIVFPIIENPAPEASLFKDAYSSLYKLPETLETYESRIQTPLQNLIPDYILDGSHISIFYYSNWAEKGNLAKLTYTHKKRTALLQVSSSASPAPKEIFSENARTRVGSTDVCFGYTQRPETFYAAWEKDHVYYCLSQKEVSHTSFDSLVASILE